MKEVSFRKMVPEDLDRVVALEQQAFSTPWTKKGYLDTLANENALYLVAEKDTPQGKEIIGMCGVLHIIGEGDISNVAVEETHRKQGIAEAMLQELMLRGTDMGIQEFTLEVRASNVPAVSLYEKLGFVSEGRRKNFYDHPKEDALIMWKRRHQMA